MSFVVFVVKKKRQFKHRYSIINIPYQKKSSMTETESLAPEQEKQSKTETRASHIIKDL